MKCPICGKEMIIGTVQSKANAERCDDCEIVVIKEGK